MDERGRQRDRDLDEAYRAGTVDEKLNMLMDRVGGIEDKVDGLMIWKAWLMGAAAAVSFLVSLIFKFLNGRG